MDEKFESINCSARLPDLTPIDYLCGIENNKITSMTTNYEYKPYINNVT